MKITSNPLFLKMDLPIYWCARMLIALVNCLSLTSVARVGHAVGAVVYWLDARHRGVVLRNLKFCFGKEKSPRELRAIAKENIQRIVENLACAIKTASMSADELRPHVEFVGLERLQPPRRIVVALGHFGNYELYARMGNFAPGYQCVTTYRARKLPRLNRLAQSLRERTGCLYFERETEEDRLRAAIQLPNIVLGLLADHQAGRYGVRGPFLGHDCSTSRAPAVFAQRYKCELFVAICYRVGTARWRIECSDAIPTRENGKLRSPAEIMRAVNCEFEKGVLRDPANWSWANRRWRPPESEATGGKRGRRNPRLPDELHKPA
jgi:KDO2-lipid IV(A) lauroyltransferase